MRLNTELYGAIDYKEMKGSPRESYVGHQGKVQRQFLVNWDQRWQFAQSFLGFSIMEWANNAYYVKRTIPVGYPAIAATGDPSLTDRYWLYPTDVDSIQGLSPDGARFPMRDDEDTPYEKASITISYESLTHRVRSDTEMRRASFTHDNSTVGNPYDFNGGHLRRYITKITQPTAEYLKSAFGSFVFLPLEPTPSDYSTEWRPASLGKGVVVPSSEVIYIWHDFPAYNLERNVETSRLFYPKAAATLLGSVNNTTFNAYEKGTLLYLAFEYKPYRNIGGYVCGDLVYKMKHFAPGYEKTSAGVDIPSRPIGHNHQIYPDITKSPWLRTPLSYKRVFSRIVPDPNAVNTRWKPPLDTEAGAFTYNYADLSLLFQPTQS